MMQRRSFLAGLLSSTTLAKFGIPKPELPAYPKPSSGYRKIGYDYHGGEPRLWLDRVWNDDKALMDLNRRRLEIMSLTEQDVSHMTMSNTIAGIVPQVSPTARSICDLLKLPLLYGGDSWHGMPTYKEMIAAPQPASLVQPDWRNEHGKTDTQDQAFPAENLE